MNNNYGDMNIKSVNNEGFILESYWDKSVRLVTIDENGMAVDCYDKVIGELKDIEKKIQEYFKKEERRNKLIHFAYNVQPRMLIANIILTIVAFIIHIICVVYGKIDIIPSSEIFLVYIVQRNWEYICTYALPTMLILTFLSLLAYLIGRDSDKIRWMTSIIKIKPLCVIKLESDNKLNRLKSDIYNLELRKHKVKYATHKR